MLPNAVLSSKYSLFVLSLCSWLFGMFARIEWPAPINGWVNTGFASLFGIDTEEAEHPPAFYPSLDAFFTRALKPGLRPILSDFVSPADGRLTRSERASTAGMAVQVKGIEYNLNELTHTQVGEFKPYWYSVVYLSPKDYHRVHSPVAGELQNIVHIPGTLWPVNNWAVESVPQLFNRNERVIFKIHNPASSGSLFVVMVGALNVGRISSPFWPGFASNARTTPSLQPVVRKLEPASPLQAGTELGAFHLGSTVVLVGDEAFYAAHSPKEITESTSVRLGESLE